MSRQLRVFLYGAVAMGQGQGGDYQQYMDYQKYMPQGSAKSDTSDKSGSSQGGDYQKYMDYSKYMPQGSGKGGGGKGGDYQQYMDYQKYMSEGSKGSKSGGSQSADMSSGSGKGGGKGGDYKQYMDYQKYMSGGSKDSKNGGGQSADTSSGSGKGGGKGGDFQKYYSQYMSQSQGGGKQDSTVNLIATDSKSDSKDDAKKYYQNYMPGVKNWTNRDEVRDAFMERYAGSYTGYVKQESHSAEANINLNSEDSKKGIDTYSKYYSKFVPDVKNWSSREQVQDAFASKYGGSYAKDTPGKKEATSESNAKYNAVDLHATAPSFDKVTNTSPSSMPQSTQPLAASQDTVDAKTVSLSQMGAQKSPQVLFMIAVTLTVAGGVALLYSKVQSYRRQVLLQPLIEQ